MNRSSFTAADLCASFVLVLLLVGFAHIITGCGGGPSTSDKTRNIAQVRLIIQGMINYAPGNNEFYPGLAKNSNPGFEQSMPMQPDERTFGTTGFSGFEPAYRYAILIRNNYISPEHAVSILETNENIKPATLTADKKTKQKPGQITAHNFSFAMLELESNTGRNLEWSSTTNPKAALVCDRNIGADAAAGAKSIHSGPWAGVVGYNDNHAVYETNHVIPNLQYGKDSPLVTQDNLFKAGDALAGPAAANAAEADAMFTFKSNNDGGVNQNP